MSKKRLNDVVNEIFDGILAGEVTNQRQAAVEHWDEIDIDGQYLAGIEGLCGRIKSKCRSVKLMTKKHAASQTEMVFSLPAVVSLDVDGITLLPTRALSRAEFVQAIEIREQQIRDDQKALREWRQALKTADKFWTVHPDWSFGRCLDAAMGRKSSHRRADTDLHPTI